MGWQTIASDRLEAGEDEEARAYQREILYQWFEGARVSKRDLKPFQIFEALDKTNSKRLLTSLIVFLRHLNYKGLVLLMDELETVIAQSTTIRNASYENVRLLIGQCRASVLFAHFYVHHSPM